MFLSVFDWSFPSVCVSRTITSPMFIANIRVTLTFDCRVLGFEIFYLFI
jgi:hypothetical protein